MTQNEEQQLADYYYFGSLWDETYGEDGVYREAKRGTEQAAGQKDGKDTPAIW